MTGFRFQVLEASDGEHYWVALAGNGEVVATSETYTRPDDAVRSVHDVVEAIQGLEAVVVEEGDEPPEA